MKKQYFLIFVMVLFAINSYAQSPHFFGVTTYGSGDDGGTIFRTDTNGLNYSLIDTFAVKNEGRAPDAQELVEVGGKFYGTTKYGGNNNSGVLFEFDPVTEIYIIKHYFDDSTGRYPSGYLLLANNGKLYGTASYGGRFSKGTFFEFNVTSGLLTTKVHFDNINGNSPKGQMIEATTGVIYGICETGGANFNGTLYQYTISTNTLIVKDEFNSLVNGRSPRGGLMNANNGKLYGLCYSGGINNYGTIYEFDFVADSIKKLYDFDNLNGSSPAVNLIQASNGKLYGTTQYGGSTSGTGHGTLFEYDITLDTLIKLKRFYSSGGGPGYYPGGALIESTAGKFLICMRSGASYSYDGAISEFTLSTKRIVKKAHFERVKNGVGAQGNLVKHSVTGKYYGITSNGGSGAAGVIYEFDNVLDTIINKYNLSTSIKGKIPKSDLLKASNGKIYGTTSGGGDGYGVIFEVDPNTHDVVIKAKFDGENGYSPRGGIVEVNGEIYGVTYLGGNNDDGVMYKFDISTSTITKVIDITSINGANPFSGIIKGSNGKLYGTSYGGPYGYGIIFEYDIVLDSAKKLDEFINGRYPDGKLLQASNGKIYGTCYAGGDYSKGTIYEFDIAADSIKTLASFNDTNGSNTSGGLIETSNGKFFGMALRGNSTGNTSSYINNGVVYEFDLVTEKIINRADFQRYSTGYGGVGEFLEASNGKIYGLSNGSSIGARGSIIVEFDPIAYTLAPKSQVAGSSENNLIELVSPNSATIKENEKLQELLLYPNPANSILNIDSKEERINTIKIFSLSGQLILNKIPTNNRIDVSSFVNGMYIIQIETDNGIALGRFIKN